jgi:hypothetical protein
MGEGEVSRCFSEDGGGILFILKYEILFPLRQLDFT